MTAANARRESPPRKKMSRCAESWFDGRPEFRRKSPAIVAEEGALGVASGSRRHNAKSPCDLWSRAGLDFDGTSWHFAASLERGFASSLGRSQGAQWSRKPWGSSGMVLAGPGADSSRRADERGWVMRVDGVLNVSAVATRGARMMPERSKMSKIAGCVRAVFGAICHLRTRCAILGGPTLSSAACHLVWVGSSWPSRARIHSGPASST